MNLLVFSDLHGHFSLPSESPDLILLLGDNTPWDIQQILKFYDCPIFGVLGKNDFPTDYDNTRIINVHGKTVTWNGITIAGWGGCPSTTNKRMHYTEEETTLFMEQLPHVDIFISHAGPASFTSDIPNTNPGFHTFDKHTNKITCWFHGNLHFPSTYKICNTTFFSVYPSITLPTLTTKLPLGI